MKVFVTGASGFIGSRVVRALVERGDRVRCLIRETSDLSRLRGISFERVSGDVRDASVIRAGMRGCSGAIHLASPSGWQDLHRSDVAEIILTGTRNILEAAGEEGGVRTVFVSSTLALGGTSKPVLQTEQSTAGRIPGPSAYAHAKRRAEGLCRESSARGQPVVVVNPAEVYGPQDTTRVTCGNLIDLVASHPVLVCRGGTSIVHVDDVARGILAALDRGRTGQRYILGGDNLTIRELAEVTLGLLGLRRRILNVPNTLVRGLALLGRSIRLPLPFDPGVVPYATLFWFVDNQKARRELGVGFRSGVETLRPTLEWCREAGYIA